MPARPNQERWMGTDRDWKRWGATDPYFGVCSQGRFHTNAMTAESRAEFFASGEAHIARIWRDIGNVAGVEFSPGSALDFGCGVGRLVIPLARRTRRVTGVDISPSMLAEAEHNCSVAGISNTEFLESDDDMTRIHGSFDLVHSYLVLQHIPWGRGRKILQALADRVAPNGFLAVQILTGDTSKPVIRSMVKLRYVFPPANWARNLLRGRSMLEPAMQLHTYDLDLVRDDLERRGFVCAQVDEHWQGFRNTFLYARRPA